MAAKPDRTRAVRSWIALGATVLAAGGLLSVVTGASQAGAVVSPGTTTRVSLADGVNGAQANFFQSINDQQLSADGRFVVFTTGFPLDPLDATNDPESREDEDVYVRDRLTGHTTLISRSEEDRFTEEDTEHIVDAPANGDSFGASISADGRYVAFESTASNIFDPKDDPGDFDRDPDVYVCDRDPDNNGVFDERVSGGIADGSMNIPCIVVGRRNTNASTGRRMVVNESPSLSADGSTLAWQQIRVAAEDPNFTQFAGVVAVRLRKDPDNGDLLPFQASVAAPPYVNLDPAIPGSESTDAELPKVSGDGLSVAMLAHLQEPVVINFTSTHALAAAAPVPDTALVRVTLSGQASGPLTQVADSAVQLDVDESGAPLTGMSRCCAPTSITQDGSQVAFSALPLTSGPIVARVTDANAAGGPKSIVVSVNNDGQPDEGFSPALSPDGRYVAFATRAPNMHNGFDQISGRCSEGGFTTTLASTDTCQDVVARNLVQDRALVAADRARPPGELVSASILRDCGITPPNATCENFGFAGIPSLAYDDEALPGNRPSQDLLVSFASTADDLVPNDTNQTEDVFVRDFQPTVTGGPNPLDFGTVGLTLPADGTETLVHVGFGPVLIDSVTLSGAPDFTLTEGTDLCTENRLVEGGSCDIGVHFLPTRDGREDATLTIQPRGRPAVVIPVTGGVGVPPDGFKVTPNPMGFGQRLPLSPTGPNVLKITNGGRLRLTIQQIVKPTGPNAFPGDYTLTQDTCTGKTLDSGASCTVRVTFSSHGPGKRNAVLRVTTLQQGASTAVKHLVSLTGSTAPPTLLVNPAVVPGGRVTGLSGLGFAPNHTVVLDLGDLGKVFAQSGPDGAFDRPLIVFRGTTVGPRTVNATLAGTTVTGSTTFLVVDGTMQAPDFAVRR